jgi:hypothetical protein
MIVVSTLRRQTARSDDDETRPALDERLKRTDRGRAARSSLLRRRRTLAVAVVLLGPLSLRVAMDAPLERDEARIIRMIRSIQTAQRMYRSVHGYYDALGCLVLDVCTANPYPPSYLRSDVFAEAERGDYSVEFRGGLPIRADGPDLVSGTAVQRFAVVAIARARGPESLAFCGDDRGGVYLTEGGRVPRVVAGHCADTSVPVTDQFADEAPRTAR